MRLTRAESGCVVLIHSECLICWGDLRCMHPASSIHKPSRQTTVITIEVKANNRRVLRLCNVTPSFCWYGHEETIQQRGSVFTNSPQIADWKVARQPAKYLCVHSLRWCEAFEYKRKFQPRNWKTYKESRCLARLNKATCLNGKTKKTSSPFKAGETTRFWMLRSPLLTKGMCN